MRKVLFTFVVVVVLAGGFVGVSSVVAQPEQAQRDRPCNNMSRACLIEVANTYMDAQAGGPGTREAMRLAPDVHRWENGILNATTDDQLRAGSPGGPSEIWSQRDRDRVWVDGNQVFSIWIVDVRDAATQEFVTTVHIFERLQVERGVCGEGPSPCVTEVEAIFCVAPGGMAPALPDTIPDPRPSALCLRGG